MDRVAHREQVARIAANNAGGEVLLSLNGRGSPFPATFQREDPRMQRTTPDPEQVNLVVVTIARAARNALGQLAFPGAVPRKGQHFTDPAGRTYRIAHDRTVPTSATLVYACFAPAASVA